MQQIELGEMENMKILKMGKKVFRGLSKTDKMLPWSNKLMTARLSMKAGGATKTWNW